MDINNMTTKEIKDYLETERNGFNQVKSIIANMNYYDGRIPKFIEKKNNDFNHITLSLPCSNTEWTMGAWECAMKIIREVSGKGYHIYPEHSDDYPSQQITLVVYEK